MYVSKYMLLFQLVIPCKLTHFDIPDDSSDDLENSISPMDSFNSNDLINAEVINNTDKLPQSVDSAVIAPPQSQTRSKKGTKKGEVKKVGPMPSNIDEASGTAQSFFDSYSPNENTGSQTVSTPQLQAIPMSPLHSKDLLKTPIKNRTAKFPKLDAAPRQFEKHAVQCNKLVEAANKINNDIIEASRPLYDSFSPNDSTEAVAILSNDLLKSPVKKTTVKFCQLDKAQPQTEKQLANSSFCSLGESEQIGNASFDQSFESGVAAGPGSEVDSFFNMSTAAGPDSEADSFFNMSTASGMASFGMFPAASENATANVFDTSSDVQNISRDDFGMNPEQNQRDTGTSVSLFILFYYYYFFFFNLITFLLCISR